MKIGALEAGGTKMVMGVFQMDGTLIQQETLPTQEPDITLPRILEFFQDQRVNALGIGSFGPLDLNADSPTFGSITSTPKLAWRNYPLVQALWAGLKIPCAIDTDVNAAVLAEATLGAARGLSCAVYVTVGTGIGGGVLVDGQLVHGLLHPEVGHILLRPHLNDPIPKGVCPYHDGCLEGLAAGPAIGARVQGDARLVLDQDPVFDIEAYYLAQMCVNLILIASPQRIILGGGVMERKALFPKVRKETVRLLSGYIQHSSILEGIEEYIVPADLFPISGLMGAYLLGRKAYEKERRV